VDAAAGTSEHPLIRRLLEEGHRFNFFQAVTLLERALPDAAPIGGTGPAAREVLRIRPDVNLGFPPGAIDRVEWLPGPEGGDAFGGGAGAAGPASESGGPAALEAGRFRITATFLGLYGVDSPLPSHWSEEILHEQILDTTVRDFLDIFHHRIYSIFYRIWTKYRYPVQYRLEGGDRFSRRFLSLIGLESPEVERAAGLPAMRLLRYAGLLVQRPRSAAGLEAFLADWFSLPGVSVIPCTGRWVRVDPAELSRLGRASSMLGESLSLGSRVYDVGGQFRITLGPLDFPTWRRFLPGGDAHAEIRSLVRFFVTDHLDTELELRLSGSEVPPLTLDPEDPPRLGWTTWLTTRPSADVSAVFSMREPS